LLFATAVAALLLTPGPTNMLLMAAGANSGFRSAVRLVPIEVVAYLISIEVMATVLRPALENHQELTICMKLLAAAYLLRSAFRFGSARTRERSPELISARLVFVTTILNPKSIILALMIFPPHDLYSAFATFTVMCFIIGCGWTMLGWSLTRLISGKHIAYNIHTFAAGVQVLFAATIIYSTISFTMIGR
jgi:threonine/homoserine/homoserine lactone efflux protein